MKAPIKDMPAELNRRLDELDSKTRRETILKTIREIPIVGRSAPSVTVGENMSLGPWQATDTMITIAALPDNMDSYEFALQIAGIGMMGWDTKITHDAQATFTGLRPNTQYIAKVRGLDAFGHSTAWSAQIFILTEMDYTPPPVPQGLDLVADGWYVRCRVDEIYLINEPDFDGFAFYVSTTTGFTPSDDNLKFVGRSNRFIFHTPNAGITYYVKVKSYDVNGNYSQPCPQVSVVVPVPHLPPQPSDPTGTGDIVIVEGSEEIDDCDSVLTWESEASDAIRISAETSDIKEGVGSLKVEIDKYGREINQENYDDWIHLGVGYLGQRIKATSDKIKRVSAIIQKAGAIGALTAYLYSDVGGDPNAQLGSAVVQDIDGNSEWRHGTFAAAINVVVDDYYWIIWYCAFVGEEDYYIFQKSDQNPYEGQTCMMAWGNALSLSTRYDTNDLAFRVFSEQESTNKHFKISSLGATDLSNHDDIEFWIKGSSALLESSASMGEAALGEQTDVITIPTSWGAWVWDISGIAAGDRNGIAHFGFKVTAPLDDTVTLYIDYVRATKNKAVKVKFSDGVVTMYPADAEKIQGIDVDAPVAGDDGKPLFYDHGNSKFDYLSQVCRIKTGTYTGDGTEGQAITGVGFQPKFVWIFWHPTAPTGSHIDVLKLDQNWGDYARYHGSANSLSPSRINSLDADGFTVDDGGADEDPNKADRVYDYMALG